MFVCQSQAAADTDDTSDDDEDDEENNEPTSSNKTGLNNKKTLFISSKATNTKNIFYQQNIQPFGQLSRAV